MEVKLFEIRDAGTFMPVMAVKLAPRYELDMPNRENVTHVYERELYLLRRAGYSAEQIDLNHQSCASQPYIILCKLDGVEAQYDPYGWQTRARTIPVAHAHMIEHWDSLASGDVIDVQYIVGETPAPKKSEQETVPV